MIDLNSTKTKLHVFSNAVTALIDTVITQDDRLRMVTKIITDLEANTPTPEDRWGRSVSASAIGDDCARRVQLAIWPTFHPNAPEPKRLPLTQKDGVIFARGHATEPMMAEWLKDAGFGISTHPIDKETGEPSEWQHGFVTAGGQIKGFADGLINCVPPDLWSPAWLGIKPLWEHKTLGDKSWRKAWNNGVAKAHPKYDAQVHLLMPYMRADATLFTMLNADTGAVYAELRLCDQTLAQKTSDRAVLILQATRAGELLPKAAATPEAFPCAYCRFKDECWG